MASNAINIRRDVDDPFYRYKMPRLTAKIEGRGNGIKTVLLNIVEISRSLVRPAIYIAKYFGYEIGAQVTGNQKDSKYILTGSHSAEKLQDLLDGFIQKYVLCGSCSNPETDLSIKDKVVNRTCKACGEVTSVDMRDKLIGYVLKNPPNKFVINTKNTADAPSENIASGGIAVDFDLDDQLDSSAGISSAFEQQLGISSFNDNSLFDDAICNEASSFNNNYINKKVSKSERNNRSPGASDPVKTFADFFEENPSASDEEILQRIKIIGIDEAKAVAVLVQLVFDEKILSGQLDKRLFLFKELLIDEREQRALLGATERLVTVHYPSLLNKIGAIFSFYYQSQLVSEEVFLRWSENISKKYVDRASGERVREIAKPFIQWLQTAEEASSEED